MILHEVSVNAAGRVSVLLGSVDKSLRGVPDVPSVTAGSRQSYWYTTCDLFWVDWMVLLENEEESLYGL